MEGVHRRSAVNPTQPSVSPQMSNQSGRAYTAEQVAQCRKIMNTKCYYEVLGIPKGAGEDQIKKAYKKLAMLLHPDKNAAPNAEDAFKVVSKAYQCLTDPQRRAAYDTHGTEEAPQQATYARHYHAQEFMTPEEIFQRIFFGADFPTRSRTYTHTRKTASANTANSGQGNGEQPLIHDMSSILSALPMLLFLFLCLTFLSGN